MLRIIISLGFLALILLTSLCTGTHVAPNLALANDEDHFDRQQCIKGCQYRYGGLGVAWEEGPLAANGTGYTNCLEECERQFWKERDQEWDTSSKDK